MSMAIEPQQRRVILQLHHGATERALIRAAAELAQMLGVALHGVFLEDEALSGLAELPFIREFRLGTGEWQKLDRQQLAEEQRAAAAEARRLLDEAAAALGVTQLFEMVSGDPTLFFAATSQAGDIIVVAQPRLPAERLVHATAHWLEAAHGCGASVMLVPQVLARTAGSVAAVVCAESDPALAIAARIAAAAGECTSAADLGASGARQGGGRAGARPRGCRHDGSPPAVSAAWRRRMSCKGWARAASGWSCWRAEHAARTMPRYPRTLRRPWRPSAGRRDRPLNLNSGVRVASSAAGRPPDRGRVRTSPCSTGRSRPVAVEWERSRHRGTTARAVNP